jgi:hypothetical protein
MFWDCALLCMIIKLVLLLLQVQMTMQNKESDFTQRGYAQAVKATQERPAVLQAVQRNQSFKLEAQQLPNLHRHGRKHRQMAYIVTTVPEKELKHFADKDSST